jgi:5-formyltetrahydrofolate cyclo-ligase
MHEPMRLRQETLTARNNLSDDAIDRKSRAIQARLLKMKEIISSSTFFSYVSFRSEVATESLIETLLSLGKTVSVPITRVKEKRLDAIAISDIQRDLLPGYCDIPEPSEALCARALLPPETIDVVLLPGSVFDERGGRFGYGGGYYDRFVSKIPRACRIGLAFDLQLVEEIPLQAHDELLDFVVTESRLIRGIR